MVLHKVFFPDILQGHPCLMSTLPWVLEACKERAARQASSQATTSLLRKRLLCRPQFYSHCAWHAVSMSVCMRESMVEQFPKPLLFISCLIFFPFCL